MDCHCLLHGIFPNQGSNHASCTAGRFLPSDPPRKPDICLCHLSMAAFEIWWWNGTLDKDPPVNEDKNMCYVALYSQKKFAHSMQGVHQNLNSVPLHGKFNLTESTCCNPHQLSRVCLMESTGAIELWSGSDWLFNVCVINPSLHYCCCCITSWISNCSSPLHPFLCSLA